MERGIATAGTEARAIESFVVRGDWSGLAPLDRARAYAQVCAQHGLNPMSQPFAFLRLNGKEVLYATRGATDQLAALHNINREIVDGPKVIDIAGTKVAYCVARASMPNGRSETATATLPVADPVNLYMKLETKAKRRATIALLGLAMLDETELATMPADAQSPAPQPSREDIARAVAQPATITRDAFDAMDASTQAVQAAEVSALAPPPATVPKQSALDDVRESAAARHTVRELADLWRLARADLKAAKATEAGWKIIADRALALGLVPAAVKAEVRRLDDDRGPGGGQRAEAAPQHADAQGSAAEATPAQGSVARADAWRATRKGIAAHVGTIASARHLESSGRQHLRAINGDLELHALHAYADRLRALSRRTERDEEGNRIVTELPREQCFATAETWRREGPRVAVLAPRPAPSTKIAAGGAR